MSSVDAIQRAWEAVQHSHEQGRLAHAYLVVGSPRGAGKAFAENVVKLLFAEEGKPFGTCRQCERIIQRIHPDVYWLEPESKARWIRVEEVRTLLRALSQTSFESGWKVAVILYADRIQDTAANAFLKILEEPPPKTLFLLVTEEPQSLLSTIRSRCQPIVLTGGAEGFGDASWKEPVCAVLRRGWPILPLLSTACSDEVRDVFAAVKDDIAETVRKEGDVDVDAKVLDARINARLIEVRRDILTFMVQWHRDVYLAVLGVEASEFIHAEEAGVIDKQAKGLSAGIARGRVEQMEEIARRLGRNLPEALVLDVGFTPVLGTR